MIIDSCQLTDSDTFADKTAQNVLDLSQMYEKLHPVVAYCGMTVFLEMLEKHIGDPEVLSHLRKMARDISALLGDKISEEQRNAMFGFSKRSGE